MKARYIRISSSTQSTLRQLVKAHPDETLFIDVCSGSIPFNERPEALKLNFEIVMGNVEILSVSSVDRLGRNSFDVQSTLNRLGSYRVNVFIDNLGICSIVDGKPSSIFKIITDVLANVSSMEKEALLERQREGISAARAKNPDTYKGRVKGTVDTEKETLAKYKSVVKVINQHPELSLRKIASIAEVAPNTVKKVKAILDKQSKTE
jgi:DNA invertase Pin-like site-specific DNA recombinase